VRIIRLEAGPTSCFHEGEARAVAEDVIKVALTAVAMLAGFLDRQGPGARDSRERGDDLHLNEVMICT
jgi:hypothetical protein